MTRLRRPALLLAALAVIGLIGVQPASANVIAWTDWTAATPGSPGSASGTILIPGFGPVTVTYNGEVAFAQTVGGFNYWAIDAPYLSPTIPNAPPASDIVAIELATTQFLNTITFSVPVVNPVMALVSLGRTDVTVRYKFTQDFTLLSSGTGFWGGAEPDSLFDDGFDSTSGTYVLRGVEGHGAIQFTGAVTSISWTTDPNEYWHGFTVGAPVPEPGTLLLLGSGISALALRRRRQS